MLAGVIVENNDFLTNFLGTEVFPKARDTYKSAALSLKWPVLNNWNPLNCSECSNDSFYLYIGSTVKFKVALKKPTGLSKHAVFLVLFRNTSKLCKPTTPVYFFISSKLGYTWARLPVFKNNNTETSRIRDLQRSRWS